jgi:hypothetical protein
MRSRMGGSVRMRDEKTLCARCGHERRWHLEGYRCEEARKSGYTCRCPKFADPGPVKGRTKETDER